MTQVRKDAPSAVFDKGKDAILRESIHFPALRISADEPPTFLQRLVVVVLQFEQKFSALDLNLLKNIEI